MSCSRFHPTPPRSPSFLRCLNLAFSVRFSSLFLASIVSPRARYPVVLFLVRSFVRLFSSTAVVAAALDAAAAAIVAAVVVVVVVFNERGS